MNRLIAILPAAGLLAIAASASAQQTEFQRQRDRDKLTNQRAKTEAHDAKAQAKATPSTAKPAGKANQPDQTLVGKLPGGVPAPR